MLERIRRLFGVETRLTFKDPELNRLFGVGTRSLAGPIVTETTAFTCAAFWDGVNQLSSDIAKLPLTLHRRMPNGSSEPMSGHPTNRLVKISPNEEMRSLDIRRTLLQWALVYGNGYAEVVRDRNGMPRALWPLHPNRVEPFLDDRGNRQLGSTRQPLRYRIDGDVVLEQADVLHIKGLSDDAIIGINLVSVAREALGLALASQQFASAFFGHGTRFGGVLQHEMDELDPEQIEEVRTRLEALHAKADQAFRMLILGSGWKFTDVGVAPNDAQMKEIRDQQVAEVARFLNMPLYKLKLNEPRAVSYASVEMAALDYYKGPILTWVTTWEQELAAKLIPQREMTLQFFKHNVEAFLRGDSKTQAENLTKYWSHGILSQNEIREKLDFNSIGEDGDVYFIQGAMVPSERAIEPPPPPPAPEPAPPEEPEEEDDEQEGRVLEMLEELEQAKDREREARERLAASEAAGEVTETELKTLRVELGKAVTMSKTVEDIAQMTKDEILILSCNNLKR